MLAHALVKSPEPQQLHVVVATYQQQLADVEAQLQVFGRENERGGAKQKDREGERVRERENEKDQEMWGKEMRGKEGEQQ